MEKKLVLARVVVGGLLIGGLLVSGCTGQPTSAPTPAASTPASAGPSEPATRSGVVVSGEVSAAGATVAPGTPIPAGAEVDATGPAELKVASTVVTLKKGTRLTLTPDGISLAAGAVRIDVDADHLVVTAGDLTVTPLGTGFGVSIGSSGPSVVVRAGSVDVAGVGDQPLRIIAGETLTVAADVVSLSATAPKDPFLAPDGQVKTGTGESSLRAVRLAGTFLLSLRIKKSDTPDARPGLKFKRLWTFSPSCAEGACDVVIKRPLLPFTCLTADGCGQKPTYNSGSLPYADGTYDGFLLKGKTSCGSSSGGSRKTKGTFTVTGAKLSGNGWLVTGIRGQIDDQSSGFPACRDFHLVTDITGQPSEKQ
ncbi:MAG: hypothetical protein ACOH1Y_15255 [Propionicimonas sp.]